MASARRHPRHGDPEGAQRSPAAHEGDAQEREVSTTVTMAREQSTPKRLHFGSGAAEMVTGCADTVTGAATDTDTTGLGRLGVMVGPAMAGTITGAGALVAGRITGAVGIVDTATGVD